MFPNSGSFAKAFPISHILLQLPALFDAEVAGCNGASVGYSMKKDHLEWKY